MKNKRNTGLRAGVYQESSNQKSTLFDLLASILIFLALAALLRLSDISEKRSCCSPSCWRHCFSLSCSREIRS